MRPPRPRALVFDLDGTLIDSRADIATAANAALVAHGRQPLGPARISGLVGDGARALVARAFGYATSDPAVDAPLATFRRSYLAAPCVATTLLPGALQILQRPPETTALVTNKPRDVTLRVLAALRIEASFGAIYGGGDGPLKPSATGIETALRALGIAPAHAWMIGDGAQDILAGKAAGCTTVAVPGIGAFDEVVRAGPDIVVASLIELATFL